MACLNMSFKRLRRKKPHGGHHSEVPKRKSKENLFAVFFLDRLNAKWKSSSYAADWQCVSLPAIPRTKVRVKSGTRLYGTPSRSQGNNNNKLFGYALPRFVWF